MLVALDGVCVAYRCLIGIQTRAAPRAPLPQQIPAAVEFDLHLLEPRPVGVQQDRSVYPIGSDRLALLHVLHGRVGDVVMRAPVCLTFGFRDDRISATHEYLDAQAVSAMAP